MFKCRSVRSFRSHSTLTFRVSPRISAAHRCRFSADRLKSFWTQTLLSTFCVENCEILYAQRSSVRARKNRQIVTDIHWW